jgi:hypothetical protein
VVATSGFAVGWIVETGLSALGLAIAWAMIEPPAAAIHESPQPASVTPGSAPAWSPSRTRFIATVLPASWLGGVTGAAAFFAQTANWATTENATMLVSIVTLAEALGAFLAGRLAANITVQFALAAAGTLVLGAALLQPAIFLPAVVVASLLLRRRM